MRITYTFLVAVAVTGIGVAARAQEGPGHEGHGHHAEGAAAVVLDVPTVRHRAENVGPGVQAARVARAEADRTRSAVSVPLTHPPRVGVDIAHRSYPGGRGMDITGSVWQDFSLGGYGSARQDYAAALAGRSTANAELARRDAIARAMNAWVEARYGRDLLVVRKESLAAAEQLLKMAEARVRAGTAPPAEIALARSVVGSARALVLAAEGMIIEADGELRYAVALPPDQQLEPVGSLVNTDDRDVDEAKTIALAQANHPMVLVARAQAEASDRSADVFAAAGKPFIGVGLSYTREAAGDRILGAAVSIPLPFVNPNVLESSTLRGEAAVGRVHVRDLQAQVAREVRQAVHERYHAREVREELRVGALVPGREALREITRRYEAGAVELANMLAARREVLLAEEAYLASAADVQRADVRLEHAVGGPVPRKAKS